MRTTILAGAAAAALLLGACSDDADPVTTTDPSPTVEVTTTIGGGDAAPDPALAGYCAAVDALDGGDPGFEQFFTDHPEPSLDDWAAFLPDVIASMDETLTALDGIDAPAQVADEHQAVVDAMTAVRTDFADALAAAEDGDQAGYDEAEERNQGGDSAAMEDAMGAIGAACGMAEG